jgi:DHA1 family multidrug resistance protein-like MFS transporter
LSGSRRSLAVLSFAMVVVMLGFGMVIPIFPFYIEALGVGGRELGILAAVSSMVEFVFAPIWGAVSDRMGRKPVLLIGLSGYFVSTLLMGLVDKYYLLLLVRGVSGLLSSATLSSSMAYVSDVTSDDDRASGLGVLGSAMGLGVIIGPGFGGLLGMESLSLPFFVSSGLTLVAAVFVYLLVPESLQNASSESGIQLQSPLKGLRGALTGSFGVLFFLAFLLSFGLTNFEAIFGLYASAKFGYGPDRVGVILMVVGVASALGKGLLTGPLTRLLGESKVIRGSLLAGSLCFLLMLYADTYPLILAATALFILSKTLLRPSILSVISKNTTLGQGAVLGLSNSFMSLGRIVGPLWAGYVFDLNYDYPYISGSLILFLGFIISLAWRVRGAEAIPSTSERSRLPS